MSVEGDSIVFINGRFDSAAAAQVGAMDASIQHGVGLFETMLGGVTPGGAPWIIHLGEHVDRLTASARDLGLSAAVRPGALAEAALETVRRSGLSRARVRLTITGGQINALAAAKNPGAAPARPDPGVLIAATPATAYPADTLQRGVPIAVADARANPFNPLEGHKTINYWWRLRELASAAAKGAAEALVLGVTNHVCGGCVSNIFIVKAGAVRTPIARTEEQASEGKGAALPSPVRPGVARAWAMDILRDQGVTVSVRMLGIAEVLDADEVFLTNSSWGVLPVHAVEGKPIGGGGAGPIALGLMEAWKTEIARTAELA